MLNSKIAVKLKENCLKPGKVSFTYRNVVSFFIVDELDIWSLDLSTDFTFIRSCFIILNVVLDLIHDHLLFISSFDFGENKLFLMHTIVLSEGPTLGLDNTAITAEVKCSLNITT